ncbi:uncharacterized protein N7458_002473 [Penicillium daleae]|uniref:Subtelomeric hrmA-associated cluster protein AFUB-079030/YDR124W-like helical bundle domain-containing protein n=1 Tax=Penicillium daleae TaxID=63821 RepID=A0AAD6CCT4_9EURO|nr:uncharacterized protein N7458_002473 [Penicillium daleae]KAJ5460921.1 hypothetical protein N7458_002473 [Penicillium daleae]
MIFEGNVRVEKSDSTQELASIVSTPEARQNLLDILKRQIDHDPATDGESSDGGENIYARTPVNLADPQEVMKYYETAFKNLQQINCRVIAKEFIKFIQPRKQHTHPYKGGDQRKPEWWPADVMHKEPDHLLKDDRIRLLIHIISNVRDERITCNSLRELAGDIKRMLNDPSRVEIIYEILDVCKERESIKAGKS